MRFFPGLIFALWLMPAFAEELPESKYQFQWDAAAGKISMPEMLKRLKALLPRVSKEPGDESLEFSSVYAAAMQRAQGADFEELEKLLRAMPVESSWYDECFNAYADARLRQAVTALAQHPVKVEWKATKEAVPKELADAPASFREAWKLYRTVMAPWEALVTPPEMPDAPVKKMPAVEVDLRRVVGKAEPGAWKHLVQHTWGLWCLNGSEALYHPRNQALLLSFLADGKLREAAGASLKQVPDHLGMGGTDPGEPVPLVLLTALGVDWEQVLFGSLLPITARDMATRQAVLMSMFTELDPWRVLAVRGSGPAVRQCLELIRWGKLEPRCATEFLAEALGPEPPQPNVFSSDTRPVRTVKLPPEVRAEVLAVYGEYLAPTNGPADLLSATSMMPSECVKELREPLSALLAYPVHAVGLRAQSLLGGAGLATGREAIAPALPPLAFRLLLNGKPLSGAKVRLEAVAKRAPGAQGKAPTALDADVSIVATGGQTGEEAPFSRAVAPYKDRTTDENGEVSYDLEECLEPERLGAVQFHLGPPPHSSMYENEDGGGILDPAAPGFAREEAPKHPDNEWPGPWILHEVEAQAGDKQLREVELHAADLEVKLSAVEGFAPKPPVRIMLERVHSRDPFSPESGVAKITAEVGHSGFFRRLQPGKYHLVVKAGGAARYDSGEFTIGEATVVREVKLEPGRSVRGTAVYPNGLKIPLGPTARLFRDGVEIEREDPEEWKGLSFGKYTVRLLSTREMEAEAKKEGLPMDKMAKEDRVGGREVRFVIAASTPPTLDLGKIVVPREKR